MLADKDRQRFDRAYQTVTGQQKRVLTLLLGGLSDRAIAQSLEIHESTVRKHVQAICKKFGLQDDSNKHCSKREDLIALFARFQSELIRERNQPEPDSYGKFALPTNLPATKNWVGRSGELNTLKAQLLNPATRAIAITAVCVVGLAGIGKTTLAAQLVRQLHSENTPFAAVAWESLRSPTGRLPRFDGIVDSLLSELSEGRITPAVTVLDDDRQKTKRLVKLLQDRPCLVILDNVETVLTTKQAKTAGFFAAECAEYAWLFGQLAETEHQSKVIFTSRETLVQLPALQTHTLQLEGLDLNSAVALLQSFQLAATDSELTALANRYQGHPKALEIVAALIRDDREFQSQVCKFLQNRDWLLVNTLDALIDQVVNRLSGEELRCLSQISVYETPQYPLTTTGIAAQIPEMSQRDVTENIIQALKRRQLLDYNGEKEFYQMHPLVQEKASRLLEPAWERLAHRLAYRYFLLTVKPESEWQNIEDIKPLLRAHHHAVLAEDWDAAAVPALRAYKYLQQWGDFDSLIDLYAKLIPPDWQQGGQLVNSPSSHSDILTNLGLAYYHKGKHQVARSYLQTSLSLARQVRDRAREASSLCHLGLNNEAVGDYNNALKELQACLKIANEIKDYQIKYLALKYQGITYNSLGKYQLALKTFQQSLRLAQQNSWTEEEAIALGNLGSTYNLTKQHNLAINYVNQQLDAAVKIDSKILQSQALSNLSLIYIDIQDYHRATIAASNLLKVTQDLGDKHREIHAVLTLGRVQRLSGQYKESIPLFEKSLKMAHEISWRRSEADILLNLGMSYRELGDFQQSIDNIQQGMNIYQQIGAPSGEAKALVELAKSSQKTGKVDGQIIKGYLDRAAQICKEQQLSYLTEVQKMKAALESDRS